MLALDTLRAAIESVWAAERTDIPTRTADSRLHADRLRYWAELWVLPTDGVARRDAAPDRIAIEVIVHLFVQPSASGTTAETLLDRARRTLERRCIAADGCRIRLREAGVRDLSPARDDGMADRHLVLIVPGEATEAP